MKSNESYSYWLSNKEIDIVERKMHATFMGSGFLHPKARLPIDVFFAPEHSYPLLGIYKEEDGKPYVTDASDVFFPKQHDMIVAQYEQTDNDINL